VNKERLTAFSDGVIAIIITIMVLELKVPQGATFAALLGLVPTFISYVLSFVFVAIYWNNHHHLLHAARRVNGAILWANMHLLFWLSLLPFSTGWMGENNFATLPVAVYGVSMLTPAIAYYVLQGCIVRANGDDRRLGGRFGTRFQGKDFDCDLCRWDWPGAHSSVVGFRGICVACRDVADPGSADRADDQRRLRFAAPAYAASLSSWLWRSHECGTTPGRLSMPWPVNGGRARGLDDAPLTFVFSALPLC
jgi:uncharacterized membrane protein